MRDKTNIEKWFVSFRRRTKVTNAEIAARLRVPSRQQRGKPARKDHSNFTREYIKGFGSRRLREIEELARVLSARSGENISALELITVHYGGQPAAELHAGNDSLGRHAASANRARRR